MGSGRQWLLGAAVAMLAGCAASRDDAAAGDDSDLTSLSARQRILTFEGIVYVEVGSKDADILALARKQAQTAFGALLASNVAVRTREVQNVDPGSFEKRDVLVIDPNVAGDLGKRMTEVKYAYKDEAVVPVDLARHSSLSLALLAQGADYEIKQVVPFCTLNDKESRDDAEGGLLWYDFNPTKSTCRKAIDREQRAIDADTEKLSAKSKQVAKSRAMRLFLPTAFKLAKAATANNPTYPEYDKLFGGGTDPKALTIALDCTLAVCAVPVQSFTVGSLAVQSFTIIALTV